MTEHAQPGGFLIPETIRAELLSYVMESRPNCSVTTRGVH